MASSPSGASLPVAQPIASPVAAASSAASVASSPVPDRASSVSPTSSAASFYAMQASSPDEAAQAADAMSRATIAPSLAPTLAPLPAPALAPAAAASVTPSSSAAAAPAPSPAAASAPLPAAPAAAPAVAPSTPPMSDRRSSTTDAPLDASVVLASPSTPIQSTTPAAAAAGSVSLRGIPAGLKVLVNFRATGSAPIMKKTKFTLSASHRFGMVIEWLRKTLHFKPTDALFVFCNAAFAPNPDSTMYDLFHCYQVQGELVINYAIQDAWG